MISVASMKPKWTLAASSLSFSASPKNIGLHFQYSQQQQHQLPPSMSTRTRQQTLQANSVSSSKSTQPSMLQDRPLQGPPNDDFLFLSGSGTAAAAITPSHEENTTTNEVLDDIFGSAPPSPTTHSLSTPHNPSLPLQDPSDIPRLRSIHVTNGYREGIAASKESHIQAGFDEGYSLGGEIGLQAGLYLGVLEGLLYRADDAAREGVKAMLDQAREELAMSRLLSEEHIGPDGVWKFEVPGQDAADEELQLTFADVAAAHPVLVKWKAMVSGKAEVYGVRV